MAPMDGPRRIRTWLHLPRGAGRPGCRHRQQVRRLLGAQEKHEVARKSFRRVGTNQQEAGSVSNSED